jgi:hypothetical protein
MIKVSLILFEADLYSYVRDAGKNLALHVVAHDDVNGVATEERELAHGERVLKVAHALTGEVATLVGEHAVESVGMKLIGWINRLLYDKADVGERVFAVYSKPEIHFIFSAMLHL